MIRLNDVAYQRIFFNFPHLYLLTSSALHIQHFSPSSLRVPRFFTSPFPLPRSAFLHFPLPRSAFRAPLFSTSPFRLPRSEFRVSLPLTSDLRLPALGISAGLAQKAAFLKVEHFPAFRTVGPGEAPRVRGGLVFTEIAIFQNPGHSIRNGQ